MTHQLRPPCTICPSRDLAELGKYAFRVDYRGIPTDAVLIRFHGAVYAYLNRCAHMPKALDCEHDDIFDASGRFLQCSMHQVHYEPSTGEALSAICKGRRLTPLKVREANGSVMLVDRRATLLARGVPSDAPEAGP